MYLTMFFIDLGVVALDCYYGCYEWAAVVALCACMMLSSVIHEYR